MFSFIGAVMIGFFAGLIARAVFPGNNKSGFIVTTLLGVIGSLIATYLGQAFGWYEQGDKAGFFMSVIGAVLILWVSSLLKKLSD
jgi:uncharacterized membrane protein YeaQ/YmgE (transglycosylase-associated protein family)